MKKEILKEILDANVIAHWSYSSKNYYILNRKNNETKKDKVEKEEILLEDFFKRVSLYELPLLISIREGEIKFDKLKLVTSIKEGLKRGILFGTKESLLLKLEKVEEDIEKCQHIKIRVLSNIYNSLIDITQAFFIKKGYPMPHPKAIVEYLKKYCKEDKIEQKIINYCKNIIEYYKAFEKKEILKVDGKTLDELSSQLKIYRKVILSLIEEQYEQNK